MKQFFTLEANRPFVGLFSLSLLLTVYVNYSFLAPDKRFSGLVFLLFFAPAFFTSSIVYVAKGVDWTWTKVSILFGGCWLSIFGLGTYLFLNAIG